MERRRSERTARMQKKEKFVKKFSQNTNKKKKNTIGEGVGGGSS